MKDLENKNGVCKLEGLKVIYRGEKERKGRGWGGGKEEEGVNLARGLKGQNNIEQKYTSSASS